MKMNGLWKDRRVGGMINYLIGRHCRKNGKRPLFKLSHNGIDRKCHFLMWVMKQRWGMPGS